VPVCSFGEERLHVDAQMNGLQTERSKPEVRTQLTVPLEASGVVAMRSRTARVRSSLTLEETRKEIPGSPILAGSGNRQAARINANLVANSCAKSGKSHGPWQIATLGTT
jgi:hypothetical protein